MAGICAREVRSEQKEKLIETLAGDESLCMWERMLTLLPAPHLPNTSKPLLHLGSTRSAQHRAVAELCEAMLLLFQQSPKHMRMCVHACARVCVCARACV